MICFLGQIAGPGCSAVGIGMHGQYAGCCTFLGWLCVYDVIVLKADQLDWGHLWSVLWHMHSGVKS